MAKSRATTTSKTDWALAPDFKSIPYWWDELGERAPAQADILNEVDFLVVGAGYAGLTAGRTLAAHGAKVMVVDAQQPYFGASSRNTGCWVQVSETGLDLSTPAARAFFDEFLANNEFFSQLMQEDGIDAIYGYGRYAAASHPSHFAAMKQRTQKLHSAHKFQYEVVEPDKASAFFNSTVTAHGGIFFPEAPYLQPARLAHGHYLAALRKGAHIVGNTHVSRVKRQARNRYVVTTSRGEVQARGVLLAVGAYGVHDFSAHKNILPVGSTQIATTPLTPEQLKSVWRQPMSMKNSKHCFEVVLPSPDSQRLIISGRIGVKHESTEAAAADIITLARKMFPQLGEIRATHAWNGRFCLTMNKRKCLFKDDEGVYSLTADNGGGVGLMQWLGHKAALQMLELPEGKTVLADNTPPPNFPLYFKGNDWFMPAAVALYNIRDKLGV